MAEALDIRAMLRSGAKYGEMFYALGVPGAVRHIANAAMWNRAQRGRVVSLSTPLARFPLKGRAGTSDLDCFAQIFVGREHRFSWCGPADPQYIVDCGANVGYTTAYFASRYPCATIVAVEPDAGNYNMLAKNVALYGSRVQTVRAAIWSADQTISLVRGDFGDGREWANRVADVPGDDMVNGITIRSLMGAFRLPRIDLLKIDIEGAEKEMFDNGSEDWLPLVDTIAIELHGSECAASFYRALYRSGSVFQIHTFGELTIASRIEGA